MLTGGCAGTWEDALGTCLVFERTGEGEGARVRPAGYSEVKLVFRRAAAAEPATGG